MSYLPRMSYSSGIKKHKTVSFGGLNHSVTAQDGEIYDMKNMSGNLFPFLAPRKRRYAIQTLTCANGIYGHDGLYWVDGTAFYANGVVKGSVTDSRKTFATLGAYLVILPDKAYYNTATGEFGSLESSWSGSVTFQDGTYAGEEAEGNTIYGVGLGSVFKVGDAVTISGCTTLTENNKTPIIREIDGDYLRFYENVFTNGSESDVTIARTVPDMDFLCQNENRLWGCKGDTIYASKLGDIFNWNVFDGVGTDSYAVDVGSAGDFTACCSYLGYAIFFKEENIYKVYGSKPSNFQVMSSASLGVKKGAERSLAIAAETLFYLSRTGVVSYSGGTPNNIANAFGEQMFTDCVAGSDGVRYYASMQDTSGNWSLYAYDTRRNFWHREDETQALGWAWNEGLYCLQTDGKVWLSGYTATVPEGAELEGKVESMVEFGDFIEDNPNRKGTGKLQLRLELAAGSSVTVSMQFNSDGVWRTVSTLNASGKRSYYLPIIPRRSDHFRIKIEGKGHWVLSSLVRESYSGSEL